MSSAAINREVPVDFLRSLDAKVLPAAPGHNWQDPAFRRTQNKPQSLEKELLGKSYPMKPLAGGARDVSVPSSITAPSAHQLVESLRAAEAGRSDSLSAKTYATLDDKVLRFFAYFTEHIKESAVETERHRCVTILYYPADDSFLIQEPILPNSGLQGGAILKRQRVPANPRQREVLPQYEFLTLTHIQVGSELVVFGTPYIIYACDAATRSLMETVGLTVPPNGEPPEDNYARRLRTVQEMTAATHNNGVKSQDRTIDDVIRTQRFIADSGKVLRFYGLLDDRDDGGRIRLFDVLMYVEDDTVSIVERQLSNEAVPSSYLSRRKLPKDGKMEKTVTLTFANRVNGMRETNLGTAEAYYLPQDLDIGVILNVFGRGLLLYDCDDFTRDYYRQQNVELSEAIDTTGVRSLGALPSNRKTLPNGTRPALPTPPYTGYGTYEDSLSSCRSLALKPPRGNPMDPHSKVDVLRFQMRLHNPERLEDRGRLFTLNYFVEDGEMMVQETALRNSGFTGGKFNRKQRLLKSFDGIHPQFYTLTDLTMGAVLNIANFKFEIVACDEHTSKFLENPDTKGIAPKEAVKVPKDRIMELLTNLRGFLTVRYVTHTEAFRSFDRDKDGNITLQEFLTALKGHLITDKEYEAIAVLRQISDDDVITHSEFFKWMSAPLTLKTDTEHIDTTEHAPVLVASSLTSAQLSLQNRVLKALKERLESRCLNSFEMFRMASSMPRAFKGRRADLITLTNTDKDAFMTQVQLQRCVEEVLGLGLKDFEMQALLQFFFGKSDRLELRDFQSLFNEMCLVGQLLPNKDA